MFLQAVFIPKVNDLCVPQYEIAIESADVKLNMELELARRRNVITLNCNRKTEKEHRKVSNHQ